MVAQFFICSLLTFDPAFGSVYRYSSVFVLLKSGNVMVVSSRS